LKYNLVKFRILQYKTKVSNSGILVTLEYIPTHTGKTYIGETKIMFSNKNLEIKI